MIVNRKSWGKKKKETVFCLLRAKKALMMFKDVSLRAKKALMMFKDVSLRAKKALMIIKDVSLRARRALLQCKVYMVIVPFWFSAEHH